MEEVNKWLKAYGLNDTEIIVYTCILGHPATKVSDIQRHTGLVRTTIYYTLAQLKSRGLVAENIQNNVKTYRATGTDILRQNIETDITAGKLQLEQLDTLETVFEQITSEVPEGTSYVSRFEGIRPIKQALEEAMRCESKRWHIIASRDNFLYHVSKQYQQYYLDERKRRRITAKTLWEPVEGFRDPSLEDIFYRNPRKLPQEFLGSFNSLVILYDDTTLIIDSYDLKTAHAIHNPTSTNLLRLLHEFAWNNSSPISAKS